MVPGPIDFLYKLLVPDPIDFLYVASECVFEFNL